MIRPAPYCDAAPECDPTRPYDSMVSVQIGVERPRHFHNPASLEQVVDMRLAVMRRKLDPRSDPEDIA